MPPVDGGPSERVYLEGREGTPDILIAKTQDRTGLRLAEELGHLLGLPSESKAVPY